MIIKKFTATTLAQALSQVREDLGTEPKVIYLMEGERHAFL